MDELEQRLRTRLEVMSMLTYREPRPPREPCPFPPEDGQGHLFWMLGHRPGPNCPRCQPAGSMNSEKPP
jgi:hypothetical protein